MLPRLRQAPRAAVAGGAAATRCPAPARPEWARRARSTLTHPHLQTLAPPRPDDPTKAATATKAFSTSATASLPRSSPSTLKLPTRHRDLLNRRTRPPSLCRYTPPALCSPRRYATSPIMAHEWSGNKVRKTFFDFFSERGHSIGM